MDGIASHCKAVKTLEAFGTGTIIATELGSLKFCCRRPPLVRPGRRHRAVEN